jgi:hypothetical protein
MTNLQSPGVLSWSGANAYDSGFAPSIAASGTTVVELHQTQATASQMMYQVGTVTGSGVAWSSPYAWEWGAAPSVAIANTPYGTYVVEVHQGGQGFGPLWYSIGTISGSSITWTPSAIYDYGVAPRLAVFEDRILEVHQSGTGVSPLWYHLGTISGPFQSYPVPSTPVAWDANPHEYATGLAPAIAFDPLSIDGYEVHQQSAGLGAMVEVPFTTRPAVPAYAQAEGQWCWATVAEMIVQTLHGLNLANEPSAAAELECQAVNTHERLSGIGNNGGTFLDCCGPGAFDSTTWRYCECNRGGWYGGVLQESGVTFTDYQAPIKFTQVASEIANGRPVPVGFNWNPPGTGGHYMLITGTEVDGAGRSWAVVNDPSGGTQWIFNYLMLANTSTASPWPFSVNEMSTNMTAH